MTINLQSITESVRKYLGLQSKGDSSLFDYSHPFLNTAAKKASEANLYSVFCKLDLAIQFENYDFNDERQNELLKVIDRTIEISKLEEYCNGNLQNAYNFYQDNFKGIHYKSWDLIATYICKVNYSRSCSEWEKVLRSSWEISNITECAKLPESLEYSMNKLNIGIIEKTKDGLNNFSLVFPNNIKALGGEKLLLKPEYLNCFEKMCDYGLEFFVTNFEKASDEENWQDLEDNAFRLTYFAMEKSSDYIKKFKPNNALDEWKQSLKNAKKLSEENLQKINALNDDYNQIQNLFAP